MKKHSFIMLLCCLIPILVLAALWAIGVSESYLVLGVLLLCPLLHVVMMRGMHTSHKDDDAPKL